jgi:predicted nucleotide-binding protein
VATSFLSQGVEGQVEKSGENRLFASHEESESPLADDSPLDSLDAPSPDNSQAHTPKMGVATESKRLFITHGKNFKILDQVKQIVLFGKFEPVIAIEHETPAKPVPQKVMDDMRTCDAAVIHVSIDRVLYDEHGTEVPTINDNVLIEIGAAMALYDDRFVLLVEEGLTLPSNLQGLYECRYQGSELTMEATMKLLKAFNEFGEH